MEMEKRKRHGAQDTTNVKTKAADEGVFIIGIDANSELMAWHDLMLWHVQSRYDLPAYMCAQLAQQAEVTDIASLRTDLLDARGGHHLVKTYKW